MFFKRGKGKSGKKQAGNESLFVDSDRFPLSDAIAQAEGIDFALEDDFYEPSYLANKMKMSADPNLPDAMRLLADLEAEAQRDERASIMDIGSDEAAKPITYHDYEVLPPEHEAQREKPAETEVHAGPLMAPPETILDITPGQAWTAPPTQHRWGEEGEISAASGLELSPDNATHAPDADVSVPPPAENLPPAAPLEPELPLDLPAANEPPTEEEQITETPPMVTESGTVIYLDSFTSRKPIGLDDMPGPAESPTRLSAVPDESNVLAFSPAETPEEKPAGPVAEPPAAAAPISSLGLPMAPALACDEDEFNRFLESIVTPADTKAADEPIAHALSTPPAEELPIPVEIVAENPALPSEEDDLFSPGIVDIPSAEEPPHWEETAPVKPQEATEAAVVGEPTPEPETVQPLPTWSPQVHDGVSTTDADWMDWSEIPAAVSAETPAPAPEPDPIPLPEPAPEPIPAPEPTPAPPEPEPEPEIEPTPSSPEPVAAEPERLPPAPVPEPAPVPVLQPAPCKHTTLPLPPPGEDVFPFIVHKPKAPPAAAHTSKKTLALFDHPMAAAPVAAAEPVTQFYSMPGFTEPAPASVAEIPAPPESLLMPMLKRQAEEALAQPTAMDFQQTPAPVAVPEPAPEVAAPAAADESLPDDFDIPELELDMTGIVMPAALETPVASEPTPAPSTPTVSLDELTAATEAATPGAESAKPNEKKPRSAGSSLERLAALFNKSDEDKTTTAPTPEAPAPEPISTPTPAIEEPPVVEPTPSFIPYTPAPTPEVVPYAPEPAPVSELMPWELPPEEISTAPEPAPTPDFSLEMPDFSFDLAEPVAEIPPPAYIPEPVPEWVPEPPPTPAPTRLEDFAADTFAHDETLDLIAHLASPVSTGQEMGERVPLSPPPPPAPAPEPTPVPVNMEPTTVHATTERGTESVNILATADLSEEFQMMLVQHGATFAVMVDNGENAVILKAFDYNPLPLPIDPERFRVAETAEAAAGTKRIYVIQVGDWQGIVSLESDEAKLQAEI